MNFYRTSRRYIPEDILCGLSLFGRDIEDKNLATEFSLKLFADETGRSLPFNNCVATADVHMKYTYTLWSEYGGL
jgi:hypothetical protein